jgi:serine protease Do
MRSRKPRGSFFGDCAALAAACGMLLGLLLAWPPAAVFAQEGSAEATLDPRLERIFSGGSPESLADLRAMQDHVLRLTERLQKSTVGVRVGPAHGSGVIVNDGFVLTAGHVIGQPNRNAVFILHNGMEVRGKTLGMNAQLDSGLMKLDGATDYEAAEIGDSTKLKRGQWVLALGHPGGFETGRRPVLRMGRILNIGDDAIQTDCTLVGGDSGGPLFDMQGRVIAIHSRIGQNLTANLHVPIAEYQENWDRLVAGEAWGFPIGSTGPYIGVTGDPDSREARIAQVFPDSPAAQAGIIPGDVIVTFAGQEIADFPALARQVQAQRPGRTVKVEVRRSVAGEEKTVELELKIGRKE